MRRPGDEEGSAIIEFVLLTTVVLVPLVMLLATLSLVQRASYAASGAARDAARVYSTAPDAVTGGQRARAAADVVFRDYEVGAGSGVVVECLGACLAPGTRVRATATVQVPLPGVAQVVGRNRLTTLTITSSQVMPVDVFKATP